MGTFLAFKQSDKVEAGGGGGGVVPVQVPNPD